MNTMHLITTGHAQSVGIRLMSRKVRGRETEKLVAQYLVSHGFDTAHVTSSSAAGPDILGIEGLDLECKARKNFDPALAMAQLRRRSRENGLGAAVLRLNGQGEKSLDDFVVCLRLADFVYLLKASGYGRR
jgi:hypothetical protein